jgi:hypothetical protein
MYKDLISYELAEGVSKEKLIKAAEKVVSEWMNKMPGFIKWEIHSTKEGGFLDIVYWESKEDAMHAEKEMVNIPNAGDWFACYKEGTISSKNVTVIAQF